ncbi:hypothetical protein [Thermoleptolyngbya sp. C42_A2020_037]|uniref:hypothetical protein n=1 Tax=Thermoleptolyngbya sp. C42_A2020_037 TaxID=2747799 RepID=UPI001A01EF53|nr:hypothetical protein [Thermoleptolyngbya sp. C42_A2020_037]MBF2084983.1 hypothetical protein [Thermoleptolyngbya sp. C42_A2020_037]
MLSLTNRFPQTSQSLWNRFEKPFTALFLTLGLAAAALAPAHGLEASRLTQASAATVARLEGAISQRFPNGVYLYGQSQQPDQIGSAYMVFEVTENQVVGAFYMPHSSFDCFYGEVQAQELALNVIDSYEQTVHPYSVALQTNASVAATGGEAIAPLNLEGFHQLSALSENDQRILNTCKIGSERVN